MVWTDHLPTKLCSNVNYWYIHNFQKKLYVCSSMFFIIAILKVTGCCEVDEISVNDLSVWSATIQSKQCKYKGRTCSRFALQIAAWYRSSLRGWQALNWTRYGTILTHKTRNLESIWKQSTKAPISADSPTVGSAVVRLYMYAQSLCTGLDLYPNFDG